jgi:hypothetical protein
MKMTRKECGHAGIREKLLFRVEIYLRLGMSSAHIARLTEMPESEVRMIAKVFYLRHLESIWDLVSKPLKFPSRRRRSDREVPKAA